MARNTSDAVNEICLSFPEVETVDSHAMLNFRVRGKTFAVYAINHHGDGRIALWLVAAPGARVPPFPIPATVRPHKTHAR